MPMGHGKNLAILPAIRACDGTFEQLATKSTPLLKPDFLYFLKFKIPFYDPINSVVNITMLTNKIFTVLEAYF